MSVCKDLPPCTDEIGKKGMDIMVEQLKARVNNEIEEYKRGMLEKSKEEILENAYKLSIIQDFEYLPFDEMDFDQIETLMEQENIIDFLWEEWTCSMNYNTVDVLNDFFRYVIEDRI